MGHSRAKRNVMIDSSKKFIKGAIKRPGALRETLGIKEGKNIPAKKLEKATHSKNPLTKKEAIFAETLKSFQHK